MTTKSITKQYKNGSHDDDGSCGCNSKYQVLLQLFDKVLTESRNTIDTNEIIHDCYGDDASIFIGSAASTGVTATTSLEAEQDCIPSSRRSSSSSSIGSRNFTSSAEDVIEDATATINNCNNMLSIIIDDMIDHMNEKIKDDMIDVLQKELQIDDKLQVVENIINKLKKEDDILHQKENYDRESVKQVIDDIKKEIKARPKGIVPADIVSYQSYQLMKKERGNLLKEINTIQTESNQYEHQIQIQNKDFQEQMNLMKEVGIELSKTADICSLIS